MPFTLFYFAGTLIIAALSLLFLPDFLLLSWMNGIAIMAALALIACLFQRVKKVVHVCYALIILTFCLSYAHAGAINLLQQADSIEKNSRRVALFLRIESLLHQQGYQTLIAKARLKENGAEQRLFINWKSDERPKIGEIWQADIQLRPLSSRLNFGGFDRQQWYFSQNITAIGYVKSAVKIGDDFSLREQRLQQALIQTDGLANQGLLLALGFGERAWLEPKTWRIYQQTNTAHLIAISGLHIGLAMALGFWLARAVQLVFSTSRIEPKFPLLIGLLFALFYAYLAGFSIPTLRAAGALCLVSLIRLKRYYYPPFRLLWLVVAFLLLCDPLMPLSMSFWLSIGAVTALIVWYQYFPLALFQWRHKPLDKKVRWIFSLFHLQFGLLLLFTPIQLLNFSGSSLHNMAANLIAVPLYSFILVPLVLFAVMTEGALHAWYGADFLAERITRLIAFFDQQWIPFSWDDSLWLTAICAIIFLGLLHVIYRPMRVNADNWKLKPARFFSLNRAVEPPVFLRRRAQYVALALILFCLGSIGWRGYNKPQWQADMLDIGQGLAILIVKNGKGVLYDTGAGWAGGSMAELEILPYLRREGIRLEQLILSHDDNDHAGGSKAILQAYPTLKLISSSMKNYGEIDRTFCQKDLTWTWQGLNFKVLSPSTVVERADNVHSCVVLVSDGTYRLLLTGDADSATERQFARDLGKIEVLQVGHHGSKTSTSDFLLQRIWPRIALISSGRYNPWHFPHPTVVERLQRYQSAVENTAVSGQVRLTFNRDGIAVERARSDFSPWYRRLVGFSTK